MHRRAKRKCELFSVSLSAAQKSVLEMCHTRFNKDQDFLFSIFHIIILVLVCKTTLSNQNKPQAKLKEKVKVS